MEQHLDISKFLVLRRLTTGVSQYFEQQLRLHLAVLTPLFNPRTLFGELIRGVSKYPVKTAEKSFEELKTAYQALTRRPPFHELGELNTPLDIFATSIEITPAEYSYLAKSDNQETAIKISSPLKWVLSYKGTDLDYLRGLIAKKSDTELKSCVLHHLVLTSILSKAKGITSLFEALRFPISTGRVKEAGDLPVTLISCPVSTIRPSDEVVLQSTALSGTPAFEEVVNLRGIATMPDPVKDKLLELARNQDTDLLAEVSL